MFKKVFAVFALLLFLTGCARAQTLQDAPIIFSSGHWIVKSIPNDTTPSSPMVCVGIFNDSTTAVQASHDTLYIDTSPWGGVTSIAVKFWSRDVVFTREASIIEQRSGIIVFGDASYRELLHSSGLRMLIFTPQKRIGRLQILLDGFADVNDFMHVSTKCPHTHTSNATQGTVIGA